MLGLFIQSVARIEHPEHQMRVRMMTAPAFSGDKVIGTILFEGTMDAEAQAAPGASQ